jgi:hypothetical protein
MISSTFGAGGYFHQPSPAQQPRHPLGIVIVANEGGKQDQI